MPPDNCAGRFSAARSRPTRRSMSDARPRISSLLRPACATSMSSATLSSAFFHGNSVASWNTMPMRRWRTASIGATPATETFPDVGGSNPASTLSSVLFPHPDGPISETKPPFGTDRLTSFRTRVMRPATVKSTQTPCARICGDAFNAIASSAGRGGFLESRPLRKLGDPCLRLRHRRQPERKADAALDDRAERDVGQRKLAAGDPRRLRERPLEQLELVREIGRRVGCAFALGLLRIAKACEVRGIELGQQPVHPPLDLRTLRRIGR